MIDVSWQYCQNFRKIEQENLLKTCLQITYPTYFCITCNHFYYDYGEYENIRFFKTNEYKTFLCKHSINLQRAAIGPSATLTGR